MPAGSAADTSASARETVEAVPQSRAEKLDALFETLKTAQNEASEAAEAAILKLWLESGSDTVDLLMERTLKAMDEKNYSLALDFLDRIVTLEPDYVEGWNKRATVFYLTDDYGKSISDIERVLSIEPRHFGALAGLGTILRELGDDKRALEAYRQALALDPQMDNVRQAVEELEKDGGGTNI
ncbi:MAG: tetratricopeptide repeat protein [Bauldia sp.]|nr:tetratricopeptide repeat protein [Bauldia sp.]